MANINYGQVPEAHVTRGLPQYDFGHTPSEMQVGFYEWIYNGEGSAVLIAVAGSGKSTSIVNSLMYIEPYKFVTILAFNKIIADEMRDKINEMAARLGKDVNRIQAKTFHSLGFSAVCKKVGKRAREMEIDSGKLRQLFTQMYGEECYELYGSFVAKLVSLGKGRGIGCLVPNNDDTWRDIVFHHDLSLDSEEADEDQAILYAKELLGRSNEEAKSGWIDYDDQIYLPVLWRLKLWQNDYLYIDEAQDTNPVRRALARMALRPNGRLIAVGDPAQAIYGFTGATHNAIDLIREDFNAVELPLTVSYRCPRVAEEMVRKFVPHFSVWEGAPEGVKISLNLKGALGRLTATDAILCRNTAPLVGLAFRIIGSGRGCKVLGKDIGQGLISLIKKQKAQTIDDLEERLTAFQEREVEKLMKKKEEGKAEALKDRVASVFAVIKLLPENKRTVPQLISVLDDMFSDDEYRKLLTLSTIHKAKGREWDRVAVLEPGLSPSKWARQPHQYKQELNLMYVRDTRFKQEHITLIDGPDQPEGQK